MSFSSSSESSFTRHHREEMDMAFSAMDCLLLGRKAIYASTELTTGLRLYTELRARQLKTGDELRETMGRAWYSANIFDANVEAGRRFADAVRERADGAPVITPGPFSAPGWSQAEYLGFWETLIRTRVSAVWFNENWQYSNGCVFEFAVACHASVGTFDHRGRPLSRAEGAGLVRAALAELDRDSFDTTAMRDSLERIEHAHSLHQ
jgi:hypothetical protein